MSVSVPRNLEALDYPALDALETKIAARKAHLYREAESKARDMVAKIAHSVGATFELMPVTAVPANGGHPVKAKRKSKIAIKFRNPSKPEETWSGRGRPARWLTVLEKQGRKRDEFRVGA